MIFTYNVRYFISNIVLFYLTRCCKDNKYIKDYEMVRYYGDGGHMSNRATIDRIPENDRIGPKQLTFRVYEIAYDSILLNASNPRTGQSDWQNCRVSMCK